MRADLFVTESVAGTRGVGFTPRILNAAKY